MDKYLTVDPSLNKTTQTFTHTHSLVFLGAKYLTTE